MFSFDTAISRKNTASRVCKVTLKTWENLENIKNQKIFLEKAKNLKKRPNFALFEVFLRFNPELYLALSCHLDLILIKELKSIPYLMLV